MPATLQRKLVLDDTPTLVLATVEVARLQLPGHDEDDVLDLIDLGMLAFAWNIASAVSDETRRELRILPDCIEHFKKTGGNRPYPQKDLSQVVAQLLPARTEVKEDFVPSTRLRLLLNCSSTLIYELIHAKQLSVLPGTSWRTGPNGAANLTRSSVVAFLKSRRLAYA